MGSSLLLHLGRRKAAAFEKAAAGCRAEISRGIRRFFCLPRSLLALGSTRGATESTAPTPEWARVLGVPTEGAPAEAASRGRAGTERAGRAETSGLRRGPSCQNGVSRKGIGSEVRSAESLLEEVGDGADVPKPPEPNAGEDDAEPNAGLCWPAVPKPPAPAPKAPGWDPPTKAPPAAAPKALGAAPPPKLGVAPPPNGLACCCCCCPNGDGLPPNPKLIAVSFARRPGLVLCPLLCSEEGGFASEALDIPRENFTRVTQPGQRYGSEGYE